MPRNRRDREYIGRHRIKASTSHRRDPLPPPELSEFPPKTGLISDSRWSEWYDPDRLRGIDPDIISPTRPLPEIHHDETRPRPAQPKKIRTGRITAATITLMLAVPTFLFVSNYQSWTGAGDATVSVSDNTRPSPSPAHVQMVMYHINGKPERPVCVVVNSTAPLNETIYDSHC